MKELKLKDLDAESTLALHDQDVNLVKIIFCQRDRVNIKKKFLLIIGVLTLILFIGSIIITYYGSTRNYDSKLTTKSPTNRPTTKAPVNFRLPRDFLPLKYELEVKTYVGVNENLWPAEKNYQFEGTIKMHLICDKPSDQIVFHSKNLNLSSIEIYSDEDKNVEIIRTTEPDVETDFVYVNLKKKCNVKNTYQLTVNFSGLLVNELYGYYRSSYTDSKNKTHYLATTKFEPTYARRAFPCMDEPDMKATFVINLVRPTGFISFSNNPKNHTEAYEEDENWQIDIYDETVEMSTYLVAYVICDFDTISNKTQKNILVEASARPEAIASGGARFALEEAIHIIDFYENYFNVSYPLPKSTQIAIPDFNSGAMENWGLITYRESSMLYNDKTDTIANKKRVSKTVSHELAHQWFGNLVTMKWWDDLWLNEGFASWIEYLGYNFTHPEWKDLDYFLTSKLSVLVKDSYENSHPISVENINPNDIPSIFDSISYDKGASILRMINAFLKEKTFKAGVSNYLQKYKFNNARQDDLWDELTQQAREDDALPDNLSVKDIMDTWTLKKGYPVINIERIDANDTELTELILQQKWFLLNPLSKVKNNTDEYDSYKWFIPFTYTTSDELNFDFERDIIWIQSHDSDFQLSINLTSESAWYLANIKQIGFFRVNYDEKNWQLLIEQLKNDHLKIDVVSRAQLLNDLFNLGRAELKKQTDFLEVISYLKKETEPMPFIVLFSNLNYMADMLSSDYSTFESFKKFVIDLLQPTYDRLEWKFDIDDTNEIDLQTRTIQYMCSYGYEKCINQSKEYMKDFFTNYQLDSKLNNFKSTIYQSFIKYGTKDDWFKLYNAVSKVSDSEKLRLLNALTVTSDINLLRLLILKTNDTSLVRSQDETSIISNIAANPAGRRLAFDFLDDRWEYFLFKYGKISFTLANLVSNVFSNLNSEFDLKNLQAFNVRHPDLGVASKAFEETLEIVEANIRWMNTNFNSISEWLEKQFV